MKNGIFILVSFFAFQYLPGVVIDTSGNNVGIDANDHCVYTLLSKSEIISCQSGKTFKAPIGKILGAATGTPPNLAYTNFIGTRLMPKSEKARIVGAGKRVIYCAGPCKPTNDKPILKEVNNHE